MSYRRDLWELAAHQHGVLTVADAEMADVPAVELRKLAARGALEALGAGVYRHRDVPRTALTQPAASVALAGPGAYIEGESVFDLLELGHFNPKKVRVATARRLRRTLPPWIELERRTDVPVEDITTYEGIRSMTVRRALVEVRNRIPHERWADLLKQALRRELLTSADERELIAA